MFLALFQMTSNKCERDRDWVGWANFKEQELNAGGGVSEQVRMEMAGFVDISTRILAAPFGRHRFAGRYGTTFTRHIHRLTSTMTMIICSDE
jgi:hypothetical protein